MPLVNLKECDAVVATAVSRVSRPDRNARFLGRLLLCRIRGFRLLRLAHASLLSSVQLRSVVNLTIKMVDLEAIRTGRLLQSLLHCSRKLT